MNSFVRLVQNENMKMYRRPRTWIMIGLTIALVFIFGIVSKLEPSTADMTAVVMMNNLLTMFFLVNIFSIVIIAEIVASEFTWGTIKLLLIRPSSRYKILASKLVAALLFTIGFTLVFLLAAGLISFTLFKTTGMAQTDLMFANMTKEFGYGLITLFVILTFAFMLSTVFRSSGIAIGLAMFLYMTSNIWMLLFNPEKYAWAKYLIFVNLNLTQYLGGGSRFEGMSLSFSLAVLAVHVLLFLGISFWVFKKRDVAA
ncbi:ABC-2 type transport system permease protein [Paenibacillus turicensis]|uniref:ABC-2 type transport system permease protein n=1 Tax=Paenibacillus turicensis TaxID=160487 RepID=A0ABS4FMI3_9BACL|nr:DUF2705 family protein [Paenibacillus turicensis]MBP1903553.1 ABC-2 type transport system permease protein [Paenibacillus turicensis]